MQTFPTTTASPSHPHPHLPTTTIGAELASPAFRSGGWTNDFNTPAAQPPFDLMFKHGGNERGACASKYDNDVSSPSADLQLFFFVHFFLYF